MALRIAGDSDAREGTAECVEFREDAERAVEFAHWRIRVAGGYEDVIDADHHETVDDLFQM